MTRIAVDGRAPDMTDPFEATAAEFAGRAEAEKAGRFLVENMPGFEGFTSSIPRRSSGCGKPGALGSTMSSLGGCAGAARFDDAVAACSWPQEFHTQGKDTRYEWLEPGAWFQVPYRSLLVRGVDNLLVAGRCISATHEALASTRVIAPSMAQGEAAGIGGAHWSRRRVSAARGGRRNVQSRSARARSILLMNVADIVRETATTASPKRPLIIFQGLPIVVRGA